jgi:hypothetical protein
MLTAAIIVLGGIVLFLLAGAVPVQDGAQAVVFRTPAFMGLLAALAILLVAACLRRVRLPGRFAFVLTHLGIVVILAGALLGFLFGRRSDFTVPVAGSHAVRALVDAEGRRIPLGFSLAVADFRVDYYEPGSTPRHFEAALRLTGDGADENRRLAVNRPVTYRGWRFYLMSYDHNPEVCVTLTARRDPGRGVVIAGIWMVIAGTCLLGLRRVPAEEATA